MLHLRDKSDLTTKVDLSSVKFWFDVRKASQKFDIVVAQIESRMFSAWLKHKNLQLPGEKQYEIKTFSYRCYLSSGC